LPRPRPFLPCDAPVADFTHRRIPEQPAVLAAELRGAFIADTTAYGSDIFSVVSQDAPGFLKTKLLLILQRTHARDLAEPLMKTGRAHTCPSGQVLDSERLAKMLPQPHDRDPNAVRLTVCLCHAVKNDAGLVQQKPEQNLALNHWSEHGDLRWGLQQSDQAQNCVEQRGGRPRHIKTPRRRTGDGSR